MPLVDDDHDDGYASSTPHPSPTPPCLSPIGPRPRPFPSHPPQIPSGTLPNPDSSRFGYKQVYHLQEASLERILGSPPPPVLGSPGSPLSQDRAARLSATQARSRPHPGVHPHRHRVRVPSRVCQRGSRFCDHCTACPCPISNVHLPAFSLAFPLLLFLPLPRPVHRTTQLALPKPSLSLTPPLFYIWRHSHCRAPAWPTTAYLIHTARSYAHGHRPSSAQPPLSTPSPHPPPVSQARVPELASTPARQTTRALCRGESETRCPSDTDMVCTVPHLLRAVAGVPIR